MTYSFIELPQVEEDELFEVYEDYFETLTETEQTDWSLVNEN
jgi:hypothetical protein